MMEINKDNMYISIICICNVKMKFENLKIHLGSYLNKLRPDLRFISSKNANTFTPSVGYNWNQ